MFEITVNTRRAVAGNKELITTHSAGIQVHFAFSGDWDNLAARYAIFRNGDEGEGTPILITGSNQVAIPSEVCAEEHIDESIFVGVYGTDGLGYVIIPTIWTSLGVLREGATTDGIITPPEPTPDMWAQIAELALNAETDANAALEAVGSVEEDIELIKKLDAEGIGAVIQEATEQIQQNADEILEGTDEQIEAMSDQIDSIIQDGNADVSAIRTQMDQYLTEFDASKEQIAEAIESLEDLGTDTTLSILGMPADAKAAGDVIGDLNNALNTLVDPVDLYSTGNRFIPLDGSTVSVSNGTFNLSGSGTHYDVFVSPCEEGDAFIVNGTGGSAGARLYGFVASFTTSDTMASVISACPSAGSAAGLVNGIAYAPANAAWAVFNINNGGAVYKIENCLPEYIDNFYVKKLIGVNKYDPSTAVLADTMLSNSGIPISNQPGYSTTDYIDVSASHTYSNSIECGNYRKVCFYNASKTCLGEATTAQNVSTFTTPPDTVYIRISIKTDKLNYLAVLDSNAPLKFVPYNIIGGYLGQIETYQQAPSYIHYGNTLFTSTYNALGTSESTLHFTCYKRPRGTTLGVIFACQTYASHTYFCAFDSNGDVIPAYSLTGATNTSTTHTVYFGNDVAYYSVMSLTSGEAGTFITEFMYDVGGEIESLENQIVVNKDKTYQKIKQMSMSEWSELQFGMFIHWGVYSAWAGQYSGYDINGQYITVTDGTEWMWSTYLIPKDTYVTKASDFTGEAWNPDYVCKLAKSVGMKYIVITARHHEGFSLAESENTEWDISDSGCTRDVLMELKEACDRHHLKFCLYVSALMDWYDEGGYDQGKWHDNHDPYTLDQHTAFVEKQTAYMNELVEKYDPYVIWYDGGTYITVTKHLMKLFNDNQLKSYPYVIVNNRGEGTYDYKLAENSYADYPGTTQKYERVNSLCGWGYNSVKMENINNYISAKNILWDFMENMGRGFNYLLNISPKGDGSIPAPTETRFDELNSFFNKYTYFNGAKRVFNYCQPSWGRVIYVNNSLYLFLLPNRSSTITVDSIITDDIKNVYVYGIEQPESPNNYTVIAEDQLQITNIPTTSDDYYPVVRIDFACDLTSMDYNIVTDRISGLSFVRTEYNEWASVTTGVDVGGYYRFGTDNSKCESRFKFAGSTGNYKIKIINGTTSGSATYSIKLYDSYGQIISSSTVTDLQTDSSFALTSGEIYSVEIVKTGSGQMNMTRCEIVSA